VTVLKGKLYFTIRPDFGQFSEHPRESERLRGKNLYAVDSEDICFNLLTSLLSLKLGNINKLITPPPPHPPKKKMLADGVVGGRGPYRCRCKLSSDNYDIRISLFILVYSLGRSREMPLHTAL
jgi:hypothetical protein